MNKNLRKLVYAALCLALCYVLPFATGNNRALGNMLCLMHIPVFLCGFLCGWEWALAVGLIAPLLRHFTIGAPPVPTAYVMAFELAAYGLVVGLLFKVLPRKKWSIYVALIAAMLVGRLVSGLGNVIVYGLQGNAYGLTAFLTSHFVTPLPGIALQIVVIPLIVMALDRAKLIENKPKKN